MHMKVNTKWKLTLTSIVDENRLNYKVHNILLFERFIYLAKLSIESEIFISECFFLIILFWHRKLRYRNINIYYDSIIVHDMFYYAISNSFTCMPHTNTYRIE